MSVIAWDGKTLAADRRAVSNGICRTASKIFKLPDGTLFACSGLLVHGLQVKHWLESGAAVENFPAAQRDKDDWEACWHILHDGRVHCYERTPYPLVFAEPFQAMGSGRDYAEAAMYLGKTASEACQVACHFDVGCGNGIETLTL